MPTGRIEATFPTDATSPTPGAATGLLDRLRAGDDAAFAELVAAHGGRMLATARRLVRNDADAHDCVQEAFLSAFKALDGFDGRAAPGTWLHRITVNACLMRLRSRARKPEAPIEDLLPRYSDDGHQLHPTRWAEDASAGAERAETRALVRRRIDELPESYRTVLILRDLEGLDGEEAAALLGVTPNAVKIRLHRARQALRTLLDPSFREERP
ncbi:MAG TPA: sigma-70 family RNA polymerase sigma factor [Planctomycetota bacterium]|nr:sigma-70 family RNA polymerase sigma factor [Planctomycetota bacterium]